MATIHIKIQMKYVDSCVPCNQNLGWLPLPICNLLNKKNTESPIFTWSKTNNQTTVSFAVAIIKKILCNLQASNQRNVMQRGMYQCVTLPLHLVLCLLDKTQKWCHSMLEPLLLLRQTYQASVPSITRSCRSVLLTL